MLLSLITAAIVAAGGAYWFAARRKSSGQQPSRPVKPAGRFGAVEIRTRAGACDAARKLEGQRFLARSAPALPLPECSAAQCVCSFGKLSDRRSEGRRLVHGGLSASMFVASNRREKRDRRRTAKPSR
jgi:hypothetical protein